MNLMRASSVRLEDIVVVLSSEMKIIKANRAFSKLFLQEPNMEGLNFSDLIKPYDSKGDLQNKILLTINTGKGFVNKEMEIQTLEGDKKVFNISCSPMEDNTNVLLVVHDTTIQRYSDRQREDIIGFVAHELRNPLANIVLCNELLGEIIKENNIEAATDLITRSKNNIMRLNKMIAELYDATKIASGNMPVETAEFRFGEMVKDAVETIEVLHPYYTQPLFMFKKLTSPSIK